MKGPGEVARARAMQYALVTDAQRILAMSEGCAAGGTCAILRSCRRQSSLQR